MAPRAPQNATQQFAAALGDVCAALAREIVSDGEGATVLLEIAVSGAASTEEADAVARRIATSPLVKTAAFGRDPNWGRVLAAAGSAPWNGGFARVETDRLSVSFDGAPVFVRGEPTGATPVLDGSAVSIDLDLGLGDGSASYLASDLTVRLRAPERGVHDLVAPPGRTHPIRAAANASHAVVLSRPHTFGYAASVRPRPTRFSPANHARTSRRCH